MSDLVYVCPKCYQTYHRAKGKCDKCDRTLIERDQWLDELWNGTRSLIKEGRNGVDAD